MSTYEDTFFQYFDEEDFTYDPAIRVERLRYYGVSNAVAVELNAENGEVTFSVNGATLAIHVEHPDFGAWCVRMLAPICNCEAAMVF